MFLQCDNLKKIYLLHQVSVVALKTERKPVPPAAAMGRSCVGVVCAISLMLETFVRLT